MKKLKMKLSHWGIRLIFLLFCFQLFVFQAYAQNKVSGTVTFADGEPIPGATIVIKGTSTGIATNIDGNFMIEAGIGKILVVSFVGMKSQEITVSGQRQLKIVLEQDVISLDEVVAIGYGTMKKSDLTGSSVSANIVAFRESPNISILQSLQGSVPGVTIGQTNQAGQEASINIRGISTLNGSTSPLIVVDGITFSGRFSDINPSDVSSVEVLKDASSKAIYGAQAANGVILVTTKTGKKGEKPIFTYSGSLSTSSPTNNAQLLGRDDFLQKVRNLEWRKSYTPESGFTVANQTWNYPNSDLNPALLAGIEAGNNFDWYKETTRPSFLANHTLGASGVSTPSTAYYSNRFLSINCGSRFLS